MELQQLCEEPLRGLFRCPGRLLRRQAFSQARGHVCSGLPVGGDRLGGVAWPPFWPRQWSAARILELAPQRLEPVPQAQRGEAVIAIVALDQLSNFETLLLVS